VQTNFQINGLLLKDTTVARNFDKISNKLLSQLEDIIEESYISNEELFQSLFMFKALSNNETQQFEISYSSCVIFKDEDSELFKKWILDGDLVSSLYYDKFYRVDLKNYILLFQIYFMENGDQIYIGYLLKNTMDSRFYLIELLQQSLFKKLL